MNHLGCMNSFFYLSSLGIPSKWVQTKLLIQFVPWHIKERVDDGARCMMAMCNKRYIQWGFQLKKTSFLLMSNFFINNNVSGYIEGLQLKI